MKLLSMLYGSDQLEKIIASSISQSTYFLHFYRLFRLIGRRIVKIHRWKVVFILKCYLNYGNDNNFNSTVAWAELSKSELIDLEGRAIWLQ